MKKGNKKMNIETANRLLQLRKKHNLSQEELAEKIGVSRQAISKWERAEASPDTDNLILLAEIYGVSLDELIKGKPVSSDDANPPNSESDNADCDGDDADENCDNSEGEGNSAQTGGNENSENPKGKFSFKHGIHIEDGGDVVHIGLDGVHVHDKNGDKVDVGWDGVHVTEGKKHGDEVHIDKNGVFVTEDGEQKIYTTEDGHIIKDKSIEEYQRSKSVYKAFKHFPYAILCLIAYLIFGFCNVCGGWAFSWIVFLTIPLYYTIVTAIYKRRPDHFAYPVLAAMLYLIFGFCSVCGGWAYGWVIFLTIPLYYFICSEIKKLQKHKYE